MEFAGQEFLFAEAEIEFGDKKYPLNLRYPPLSWMENASTERRRSSPSGFRGRRKGTGFLLLGG